MKITDEAVEAGAAALERMYKGPGEDPFYSMAKNVLEAALPHLMQGAVRVKPLEWDVYPSLNRGRKLVATDCFGMEYARLDLKDQSPDEIEEYEARVQAEYNRAILSALSPAPVGVADVGQLPTQQEAETLQEGIKEIAEREQSIRDNWARHEAKTGARILELEELLQNALAVGLPDEVATPIRAVLGGQSNG